MCTYHCTLQLYVGVWGGCVWALREGWRGHVWCVCVCVCVCGGGERHSSLTIQFISQHLHYSLKHTQLRDHLVCMRGGGWKEGWLADIEAAKSSLWLFIIHTEHLKA